jgi:hypothetical protein
MRKVVSVDFGKRMSVNNAAAAMHQGASMGMTEWANKDIRKAASTGDWSELIQKAQKSTKYFRNQFYR